MIKIPIAEPCLGEEELDNATRAIKSGWISSKGEFISKFENEFSRYCSAKYGIATCNGTAALHLALLALGINKNDEVIVPDFTFIATANAVTYCNARPIFIDSHPKYWCIDPAKIEEKINKRTKAIVPVHIYGHPCEMNAIIDIARDYNLFVVEDAAEAHGAEYKGKKVGSFGDVSCFSFFGNKIMTTGEGGICITNDEDLAKKIETLRDHGMNPYRKYWHDVLGFNYRMTNIQAAIGLAQLRKLDSFIEKKIKIAKWYSHGLNDLESIKLHPEMPWGKCVYWMYSILTKDNRNKLMRNLSNEGIESRPFFYPIHEMPVYRIYEEFPIARELSMQGINLPSGVTLEEDDVDKIIKVILESV